MPNDEAAVEETGSRERPANARDSGRDPAPGEPSHEARETFEAIVATLHEPLLVLAPDLRVQLANPAFYAWFGGTPEATEGEPIFRLGGGQWDIPALRSLLEEVLSRDRSFDGFEIAHEFAGIGPRTMLVNARRLDPMPFVVLGIRDVTERKRLEAERDRERFLLEAILDTLPVGLVIADRKGNIVRDNAATRELWGVPLDDGGDDRKAYTDFVAWWPETGERIRAEEWAMTRALRHGAETRNELILNQRFGSDERRYYLNNVSPLRDGDGRIIGGVAAMLDVTDRLAAERELQEAKETLEKRVLERTQQMRTLAARLSLAEQRERSRIAQVLHDDVQQLLHALNIRMRQMIDRHGIDRTSEEAATADELLRRAIGATRTLTAMVDPPLLHDMGLAEALRWLAERMHEWHGLALSVDLAFDDLGNLDDGLLVMIFHSVRELLFNIVKHSGVNHARIVGRIEGSDLVIEVSDEGRGFDPAQAFAQKQRGFGLRTIQERMRLNGGELEVGSVPGKGTRKILRLPLQP